MAREKLRYYLGCSGYFYFGWEGLFYPKGLDKNKWLEYYTKKFNSVEINSSFYHFPTAETIKGWYARTPKGFVLTIKANRLITHIKKFKDTKKLTGEFYRVCNFLKEKLGCVLFQLPPSLHYNKEKLREIVGQLDRRYKNIIEFRHESWFCKEVYSYLGKKRIGFCAVSAPGLPEDCLATTDVFYMRFHGKKKWYMEHYIKKELQIWAKKIKKTCSSVKEAYIYFNNDYNAYAPKNCRELEKYLKTGGN